MEIVFEREVFLFHETSCTIVQQMLDKSKSDHQINYISSGIVNILMPLAEEESELEILFDDVYSQGLMSEDSNILRSLRLDDHNLHITLSTGSELDEVIDRNSLLN